MFSLNTNLNKKQQVLALRKFSTHHCARHIFKSVGLTNSREYGSMKYVINQMKSLTQVARRIDNKKVRANDDKRGMLNSLELAFSTTPPMETETPNDLARKKHKPSGRAIPNLFGVPVMTMHLLMSTNGVNKMKISPGLEISNWSI